ncbi:TetR/AcrR family transcriptional regulator [Pleurocapsa sp. FMAR1]|uniref:TetR/AcrR family transcriptional regulator n=1 Tax=Pleurocapsa sp. FMAR1 TaxID=3040204 RepID=UPI0029C91922|nr:TetR/AcrR family transcriptional regulator [Pleurocapsa sp. FMAR1]
MAAKRNFDSEEVLDGVMRTFWSHGYRGTSLEDLARATGLRKGSLHNAFGNKEDLFLLALERYAQLFDRRLDNALDDPDPYRAIERFLEAIVERMSDSFNPRGCLSTYACIEWQDLPPKAAAKVSHTLAGLEEQLTKIIKKGQQQSNFASDKDARSLARFLIATTRGMATLHKVTGDLDTVRDVANCAIGVLK